MKFKKHDFLNYSLIDLSGKKGRDIRDGGKFFVCNPSSIDDSLLHHIIFVHGYNNDFFEALENTYRYFDTLSSSRNIEENYIGIYWPGNTGFHFSRAVRQSNKAALNMASMINHLVKSTKGEARITLIAHSLGNRICAKAVLLLKRKFNISPVINFIQLAPAIDADVYQEEFERVPDLVRNIVVYHSSKDKVLNDIYDTWNKTKLKFGRRHEALGTYGPYPRKVSRNVRCVDAEKVAGVKVGHSTYLKNEKLVLSVSKNILLTTTSKGGDNG